jgi:Na+-transporting NADH:ubiquinone oxidoreductase subunit NqrF
MPPRLIVKKRPVESELVSDPEKPKVKRVVKKKVRVTTPDPDPEPEAEAEAEAPQDPSSAYLASLNNSDRVVLAIAKDHLGTSFCMEKSVGFVEFLASRT